MLGIAQDQHSLALTLADHELEPRNAGIDREEGDSAVVILARCYSAFPLAEVEYGGRASPANADLAKRSAGVAVGELPHLGGGGRHHQALSFLRHGCLVGHSRTIYIADRLRLPVEQNFEQA